MTGGGGEHGWRRAVGGVALGIAAASVAALGWLWYHDRSRAWEPPRWDPARFVALGASPRAPASERWLVAVNLGCPHCLESLRNAVAARELATTAIGLEALVVDTAARPAAPSLPDLPGVRWWWDPAAIWRRRWGHRVYGEIVVFDSTGSWRRTLPPMLEAPGETVPRLGVPPDDL